MTVIGSAEFDTQMARLITRTIPAVIGESLIAASRVAERGIATRLPRRTGELQGSIGSRIVSNRGGVASAKVGVGVGKRSRPVKTGGKSKSFRSRHAHFYILGTADRYTARGAFRGRVPPNNAIVRAFSAVESSSIDAMRKTILRRIAGEDFAKVSGRSLARLIVQTRNAQ